MGSKIATSAPSVTTIVHFAKITSSFLLLFVHSLTITIAAIMMMKHILLTLTMCSFICGTVAQIEFPDIPMPYFVNGSSDNVWSPNRILMHVGDSITFTWVGYNNVVEVNSGSIGNTPGIFRSFYYVSFFFKRFRCLSETQLLLTYAK